MKRITILAMVSLLAACCDKNDMACKREEAAAEATEYVAIAPPIVQDQKPDRITVTRVKVIADSLAYGGQRGVYLIKDNETGEEFIGVSGVGVSTLGSHSCGKGCTQRDER